MSDDESLSELKLFGQTLVFLLGVTLSLLALFLLYSGN